VHLFVVIDLSEWLNIMTIEIIVYNQIEAQQVQSANQRTHLSESDMLDILKLARKTNARDWAILRV
jgi:hypothetical protein